MSEVPASTLARATIGCSSVTSSMKRTPDQSVEVAIFSVIAASAKPPASIPSAVFTQRLISPP